MESDTFYGDFMDICMILSVWRLSGNLTYRVFGMKTSDHLQTNFTIKFP